jgi:hypothetical protein
LADDADLGKDTQDSAPACDPTDIQRATSSLEAYAHGGFMTALTAKETPNG